jgi:hypothetical protein
MQTRLTLALTLFLAGGMVFAGDIVPKGAPRPDLTADELARVLSVTSPTSDFSHPENFETNPAGKGTTRFSVNANAFSHFLDNLSFEQEEQFKLGNALFRKIWVSSPQLHAGLGRARAIVQCAWLSVMSYQGWARSSAIRGAGRKRLDVPAPFRAAVRAG